MFTAERDVFISNASVEPNGGRVTLKEGAEVGLAATICAGLDKGALHIQPPILFLAVSEAFSCIHIWSTSPPGTPLKPCKSPLTVTDNDKFTLYAVKKSCGYNSPIPHN